VNAAVAGFQTIAAWPDPPSRKQYAAPRLDQLNTRGPGGPDADDRSAANPHVDRCEHVVTVKYPRPRNDEMIHCSPLTGISRRAPLLIFAAGSVGVHTDPRSRGVRFRRFTYRFRAVGVIRLGLRLVQAVT
jgi:hypothetical protein